ncbi:MAG TPA: hypothetical protein VFV87_15675 [Pirellulaceae bacterium]|nr:hypothetical protein [Pirellulaceae bacterium]
MADKSPRRWLQFRLQSVLWLMLCIALAFSAYRYGYRDGFEDQANQRSQVGGTYAKVYRVGDAVRMVKTKSGDVPDMDGLVRDVTANVLPNTWDTKGGGASIAGFALQPTVSLVVSHDQDGHERITAYLERLRRKKSNQLPTSK